MFNKTRTLFPSYSGAGDVKVSLPNAPSRASAQRDTESLWDVHTSEPHVVANSDPGISVPLPNDGFDPQGLSETNEANILVNRGGSQASENHFEELQSSLDEIYTETLVSNLNLSSLSLKELKEYMLENAPGSLLVYNGSSSDDLIQAFSLIQSLETLADEKVAAAVSTLDMKELLLSFMSKVPSVRDAMLLPDLNIRQTLLGSTENRNSLSEALQAFGLEDDDEKTNFSSLKKDDAFFDYKEAVLVAECELNLAIQKEICMGLVSRAMDNALRQVKPYIASKELVHTLEMCVDHCRNLALSNSKKFSRQLATILKDSIQDLKNMGAEPQTLEATHKKVQSLENWSERKKLPSVISRKSASSLRSSQDLVNAQILLQECVTQLRQLIKTSKSMHKNAQVAMVCELYTLMCFIDCCVCMQKSENSLKECVEHLHKAFEEELSDSAISNIFALKKAMTSANKDLQYAQKSQIMNTLTKAKEENKISDRKLQTLTSMIG